VVAPGALGGDYWGKHIAMPVQFARGVETLLELGAKVVLEIGPDRVLSSLIAADHGGRARSLASCVRGADAEATLFGAVAALYELGLDLDFAPLCGAPRMVSLPARRLAHKRYWSASADEVSQKQGGTDMGIETSTIDDVALIREAVRREVAYCLKQAPQNVDVDLPFADVGADSLILLEALHEINARYGVSLTVPEIYEKVSTIAKVARLIHERRGAAAGAREPAPPEDRPVGTAVPGVIEDIVRQQLDLMERQLTLLGSRPVAAVVAPARAVPERAATPVAAHDRPTSSPAGADRFSAFSFRLGKDEREDDADKVAYVQRLTASLTAKSPKSKELAQQHRLALADNRVPAGFRPLLKEMVYPIVADKAEGAYITDIDGNTYLDFTMGFGAHLFGHAPGFVGQAIAAQLGRGMPIGPQSPLAGRVAQLICELTGHARVAFCNSGTEATMTAVRLARAKAGRPKLVLFRNSYHGTFDGFLARGSASSDVSRPASLGTPDSLVADTVVQGYCDPEALDYIDRHAQEIGAVLVEPVQSRAPSLQPGAFLQKLRALTADRGIALIFDEVISGFRCARGGAHELFGVRADLCAYGKIVGGGMPIGVVAGSAAYLDGLDGGFWQFGDASFPATPTIFFAGTFSKHPLAMAAALAVLERIQAQGASLYPALDERTARLCARLNAAFAAEGVDIEAQHFASLFRFASRGNLDVFFYRVLDAGYFIWEGRNCFVSTAHTEDDLARFVESVQQICRELVSARLLAVREGVRPVPPGAPISDAQERFHRLQTSGPDGAIACNLCYGLRFDAALDLDRLARAVTATLTAHDALWVRFDLANRTQHAIPLAERKVAIERRHVAEPASDPGLVDRLATEQQKRPLRPETGDNLRATLTTFGDGGTLLILTLHHLVCDGWGLSVVFEEIAARYADGGADQAAPPSYAQWLDHEARYRRGDSYAADRRFWHGALEAIAAYQRSHGVGPIRHRNAIGGRPAGRARLTIDERVTGRIKAQAQTDRVTPFTALLGGFQLFLHRAYRGRLPVVGIPFANRATRELKQVVGSCVNLLPLLPFHGPSATFDDVLSHAKNSMAELFQHALFPYPEMCQHYQALTSAAHAAPVEITFNVEPIGQLPQFDARRPVLIAAVNDRIELDLMCNVFVLPAEITIELDYATDLFAEDAVYGLVNLYAKILENYAHRADPARRIGAAHASGAASNGGA
jgi:glutamate-1-semialdehyde aminotransferase/acyl carrier protein